jgi:hypothetical protein
MKFIITLLLFLFSFSIGFCQTVETTTTDIVSDLSEVETICPYKLGNKTIEVIITKYGNNPDIVMINLHDNESTSVEAAKSVLKETGGTLIRIKNDSLRLIDYVFKKVKYQFDPNRIFTEKGTYETLKRYSKADAAAVKQVSGFGRFIFSKIPGSPILIALHNNSDSNYSLLSYLPDGEDAKEASLVYYNDEMDIDDFFFTTSMSLYEKLSQQYVNVILQNNDNATDDGSLSVLFGQQNKDYVNVEAQHGHLKEQSIMIKKLIDSQKPLHKKPQ